MTPTEEQLNHEETERRNSQLICRDEAIKVLKDYETLYYKKLTSYKPSEQILIGNFFTVFMSEVIADTKELEIKATTLNTNSAQLVELFTISGCTSIYQVIKRIKELENDNR